MIKADTNLDIQDNGDFTFENTITQNNVLTLKECELSRINSNNGMSKDRTIQKIGSLPQTVYLKAIQDGYNMNNSEDVLKVFSKYPEFLSCNPWVTPGSNNHKIIIK